MGIRNLKIDLLFYAAAAMAVFLVRHHPFFWDTIQLGSKHAHFFYETNFRSVILPVEIDSGHLPAFGMYLAALWKIFGKTLPVSHFAMLPFLWGILFFLLKIGEKLAGKSAAPWLVLLCFSSPVLAAQSMLISPDVVLVCFFLMAFLAIMEGKSAWLALAVAGLGMVSTRGMMLAVGLYFFSLFVSPRPKDISLFFKKIIPFLPGGLLVAAFLFYHWHQTGWIGYHEDSTWAQSFVRVNFLGVLRNVAVFGWRMLDFGQVFLWAGLFMGSFLLLKKRNWKLPAFDRFSTGWQLVVLILLVALAIVPAQLPYKGLLGHRYLLPLSLSGYFAFFYLAFNALKKVKTAEKLRKSLFAMAVLGMATGNLWIYPENISQGWDSTLAHWPWYQLQKEAGDFMHQVGVDPGRVGTAFPGIGPREDRELNGVGEGLVEKDMATNCYILYSNIMNDFSDEETAELKSNWQPVFRAEKRGVFLVLYKNPNPQACEN